MPARIDLEKFLSPQRLRESERPSAWHSRELHVGPCRLAKMLVDGFLSCREQGPSTSLLLLTVAFLGLVMRMRGEMVVADALVSYFR